MPLNLVIPFERALCDQPTTFANKIVQLQPFFFRARTLNL